MKSFSKHTDDIVADNRVINNDIIGYTNQSIRFYLQNCRNIKTILILIINQKKFLRLAYGGKNDIVVFDKFDADEVSILSFKKHVSASRLLNLILVYGKQFMQMQKII